MSTHATLGVKFVDNSIVGCYVHQDGDTMEDRIRLFVKKNTTTGLAVLITEAQSKGGIRSFYIPTVITPGNLTPRDTEMLDDEPYIIDCNNWKQDHMGTSSRYLVDYQTGEIIVKNIY